MGAFVQFSQHSHLVQTNAGSVIAASVSLNLYKPHLVDCVDCVLNLSDPTVFSSLLWGSPGSPPVFDYEFLHLLTPVAGGLPN